MAGASQESQNWLNIKIISQEIRRRSLGKDPRGSNANWSMEI